MIVSTKYNHQYDLVETDTKFLRFEGISVQVIIKLILTEQHIYYVYYMYYYCIDGGSCFGGWVVLGGRDDIGGGQLEQSICKQMLVKYGKRKGKKTNQEFETICMILHLDSFVPGSYVPSFSAIVLLSVPYT